MNSLLTSALFSTPDMDAVFGDRRRVQAMLDAEAALARAQEAVGLIPSSTAEIIASACNEALYDLERLGRETASSGNPAIPLVRALIEQVRVRDEDAAQWVHYGATSQDIIDTGMVLQVVAALRLLAEGLDQADVALIRLIDRHVHTVMPGRTLLQHATPTTFGLKAAGWLDSLRRARRQLDNAAAELAPQLGGAAGTLGAMGDQGAQVLDAFAQALNLASAPSWHARRERVAALGAALAILVGVLGKAAGDITLMMQTEVSEVREPASQGGGGSSAMPHKRNPVSVVAVSAAALRAPGLAATLMALLPQAHERDAGGWHAEWEVLPELFRLAGGAVNRMADVFAGLEVDAWRMAANFEMINGLLFSEGVAQALTPTLGKAEAHAMVRDLSARSVRDGVHLKQALAQDATAAEALKGRLDSLFDPAAVLGGVPDLIRRLTEEGT